MKSAADSDSDSNSSIFVTQRLLHLHWIILASYFWTFESFIVKLVKSF